MKKTIKEHIIFTGKMIAFIIGLYLLLLLCFAILDWNILGICKVHSIFWDGDAFNYGEKYDCSVFWLSLRYLFVVIVITIVASIFGYFISGGEDG